jgi:hypothetical protein
MAACVHCGVNMVTNERNNNKRGGAAALHNDCAHSEDTLYWATQWFGANDAWTRQLTNEKTRYTAKRAGSAAQWP